VTWDIPTDLVLTDGGRAPGKWLADAQFSRDGTNRQITTENIEGDKTIVLTYLELVDACSHGSEFDIREVSAGA
jgi:hypothetical protein